MTCLCIRPVALVLLSLEGTQAFALATRVQSRDDGSGTVRDIKHTLVQPVVALSCEGDVLPKAAFPGN